MAVKKATKKPAAKLADESAGDAAPKSGRGGPRPGSGRPRKIDIAARSSEAVSALAGSLAFAGVVSESSQMQYDAEVLAARAPDIGAALDQLASDNPKIKRAIESLFKTSSWAKLATTIASVVVPIAANHGLAPNNELILAPFVSGVGMPPARPVPAVVPGPWPGVIHEPTDLPVGPNGVPIVLNDESASNGDANSDQ